MQSRETVSAPIKASRSDHAIHLSLKNVTAEDPSHEFMEQAMAPYPPARLAAIKPVLTVVERVPLPARMQIQSELPLPMRTLPQHSRADAVLFDTRQKVATPVSGSHTEETYFSHIRELLEAAKQYPESARRGGIEGSVGIGFCINRQGYLVRNIEVFRSSGSPALDQASVACVKKVAKFPPLPDVFQKDLLKIRVNIVFKLRGQS